MEPRAPAPCPVVAAAHFKSYRAQTMNLQFNPQSIDGVTDAAMAWLYLFVPQLIGAVLVLAIGLTVVHFGTRAIGQALGATKRIDISVRQVLVTALRYAL